MKKMLSSLLLLIGCGEITVTYPSDAFENVISVELDPRLLEDDNGYYHLEIDTTTWQTIHRLSGHVYLNGEPLDVLKIGWTSSHYWYLGDTLGYIVNRYLTNDGIYVSVDTSYVIGFNGMEVSTINPASYSNPEGEVNTMFAPVRSMLGDTITVWMMYFDEWNFEYNGKNFMVVLD